jgi:hypothetical protein
MDMEIMKLLIPKAKPDESAMQMAMWQAAEECLDKISDAKTKDGRVDKDIIRFFDWWEIELEMLQARQGIGMPTKDDPRYAAMKT